MPEIGKESERNLEKSQTKMIEKGKKWQKKSRKKWKN